MILRKSIDDSEPVIFTEIEGPGIWPGRILHPLLINQCLLVSYFNQLQIFSIDKNFTKTNSGNFAVQNGSNMFLQTFGEVQDKIGFLTDMMDFSILKVNNGLNSINFEELYRIKITGIENRLEKGISFTICDLNNYAFIHLYEPTLAKNIASSIAVFRILEEKEMEFVSFIDLKTEDLNWFAHNFKFIGYIEQYGILNAIEFGEKSKLRTYIWDTEKQTIEEIERLRGEANIDWLEKLIKQKGVCKVEGLGHDNTMVSIEYL